MRQYIVFWLWVAIVVKLRKGSAGNRSLESREAAIPNQGSATRRENEVNLQSRSLDVCESDTCVSQSVIVVLPISFVYKLAECLFINCPSYLLCPSASNRPPITMGTENIAHSGIRYQIPSPALY